jgi:hypothetical protein
MAENLKFSRNLRGKIAYDRYDNYDNYDAIEVGTYKEIPSDYDGVMGVPVTFLDKHNPEQFEILGITDRDSACGRRPQPLPYSSREFPHLRGILAHSCGLLALRCAALRCAALLALTGFFFIAETA